jgi:hypothetical protein
VATTGKETPVKQYGLTCAEYWRFIVGETANPEPPAPLNTELAAGQLRSRGYNATVAKLNGLVRLGRLPGSDSKARRHPAWTPERIQLAADLLEQAGDLTPLTGFLAEHGLGLRDFYAALAHAHAEAVDRYGSAALSILTHRPDADHFRMIVDPAHGKRKAKVAFDLLPEVQREIEKAKRRR